MEKKQINQCMHIRPQLLRACGIDVHKAKLTSCFYKAGEAETVKGYGTFTGQSHCCHCTKTVAFDL